MSSIVRSACWDLAGTDASTASNTAAQVVRKLRWIGRCPRMAEPFLNWEAVLGGRCIPILTEPQRHVAPCLDPRHRLYSAAPQLGGRAGAFYGPCCPYSRTCRLYRNARLCHLPQSPCGTDRADRRVALQGAVLAAVD